MVAARGALAICVRRHSNVSKKPEFIAQQVLAHGSAEPIVARTVLQTSELVQAFPVSEKRREALKQIAHDTMLRLLAAKDAYNHVATQLAEAQARVASQGLDVQAEGRFVSLPAILNLQADAENFLREVKLALAQIALVFTPFYKTKFDHRFQKIQSWALKTFGEGDELTKLLRSDADWIDRVIRMRNAVEHPGGRNGALIIRNIGLDTVAPPALTPPGWGFEGKALHPMLPEMDAILHNALTLFDDVLCACLDKRQPQGPLSIIEIPEEQRDPTMPIRFRVTIQLPDLKRNNA